MRMPIEVNRVIQSLINQASTANLPFSWAFYCSGDVVCAMLQKREFHQDENVDIVMVIDIPLDRVSSLTFDEFSLNRRIKHHYMRDYQRLGGPKVNLVLTSQSLEEYALTKELCHLAVFVELTTGKIIDPTKHGVFAILNQINKTIINPVESLQQNPIKLLYILSEELKGFKPSVDVIFALKTWQPPQEGLSDHFIHKLSRHLESMDCIRFWEALAQYDLIQKIMYSLRPDYASDSISLINLLAELYRKLVNDEESYHKLLHNIHLAKIDLAQYFQNIETQNKKLSEIENQLHASDALLKLTYQKRDLLQQELALLEEKHLTQMMQNEEISRPINAQQLMFSEAEQTTKALQKDLVKINKIEQKLISELSVKENKYKWFKQVTAQMQEMLIWKQLQQDVDELFVTHPQSEKGILFNVLSFVNAKKLFFSITIPELRFKMAYQLATLAYQQERDFDAWYYLNRASSTVLHIEPTYRKWFAMKYPSEALISTDATLWFSRAAKAQIDEKWSEVIFYYTMIIAEHPNYLDAYAERLTCIYQLEDLAGWAMEYTSIQLLNEKIFAPEQRESLNEIKQALRDMLVKYMREYTEMMQSTDLELKQKGLWGRSILLIISENDMMKQLNGREICYRSILSYIGYAQYEYILGHLELSHVYLLKSCQFKQMNDLKKVEKFGMEAKLHYDEVATVYVSLKSVLEFDLLVPTPPLKQHPNDYLAQYEYHKKQYCYSLASADCYDGVKRFPANMQLHWARMDIYSKDIELYFHSYIAVKQLMILHKVTEPTTENKARYYQLLMELQLHQAEYEKARETYQALSKCYPDGIIPPTNLEYTPQQSITENTVHNIREKRRLSLMKYLQEEEIKTDTFTWFKINKGLGLIYLDMHEYETAYSYLKTAFDLEISVTFAEEYADLFREIGNIELLRQINVPVDDTPSPLPSILTGSMFDNQTYSSAESNIVEASNSSTRFLA